jgi:hypothetical protein
MLTAEEQNSVEERIHFWLCEELRCVSIKCLTMEFENLTRQEAAELLERYIVKNSANIKYEITRCVLEKNDLGKLVLRLTKSSVDGSYMVNSDNKGCNIYAVCPLAISGDGKKRVAVSSIQASHEVDRVKEREVFLSRVGKVKPLRSIICPSLTSLEDCATWTEAKENSLPASPQVDPHFVHENARGHDVSRSKSANPISTKSITTSASSFFSSGAKKQSHDDRRLDITSTVHTKKNEGALKKAPASVDNRKDCNPIPKKDSSKKLIGNADDFVGDESSEEEVCYRPQNGQHSGKTKATKTFENGSCPSQGTNIDDPDTMNTRKQKRDVKNEIDCSAASTAINSFAGPQHEHNSKDESAAAKRVRHRQRKKYVEQTTMDENGYMHTETICVMEDILTDEEEPQQKTSANKNVMTKIGFNSKEDSKAKQVVGNKKQMGLSAFFTTKKK